jgi:methyltransferase
MREADLFALALAALAFVPMIAEAVLSSANARALRAAGAVEPARDVYQIMQFAYPASFLAMTVEAWTRGSTLTGAAWIGAAVFVAAKALKYWAIATLGSRWTFRVLVPPGSERTRRGPYRFLRHPNYVGVAGEIAGFAGLAGAPVAGVFAFVVFALLLVARIRVEERALGLRSR